MSDDRKELRLTTRQIDDLLMVLEFYRRAALANLVLSAADIEDLRNKLVKTAYG